MDHVGVPRVVPPDPHGAVVEVDEHGVVGGGPHGEVHRPLGFVELGRAVQADARSLGVWGCRVAIERARTI